MPGEEKRRDEEVEEETDDEVILADVLAQRPRQKDTVENVVCVNNVPVIPEEKYGKLETVLKKTFGKVGNVLDIHMPLDASSSMTKGFCFVEYEDSEQALRAVRTINGFKLDKQHIFDVHLLRDLEKATAVAEEFAEPAAPEHTETDDYRWWLLDERCFDQFVVRADQDTTVYWCTKHEPETIVTRPNWTESYFLWSPRGSYLGTIHVRGVQLWGGPEFNRVQRFQHNNVKLVQISPCENFLVTWSPDEIESDDGSEPHHLCIWDIRSGRKLRGFPCSPKQLVWPMFKWSHDDKYVARMGEDKIQIYELPTMKLLDKKSFSVPGVRDFAWSPAENILSYWTPEMKDQPARVTLISIPSKETVKVKNLFNVSDCKLHWQNKGDFLSVKIDRHTKTGKSKFTTFELFSMREKGIPVEPMELQEQLLAFAWEPNGARFAIIHGDGPQYRVSFYEMRKGEKVALLKTLDKKPVNQLFWSPNGRYIVLAGLGGAAGMTGALEFYDSQDLVSMNQDEHFMATHVEWDPTGRYVMTYVCAWKYSNDTGYTLWSFQGRQMQKVMMDKFYQLLWRPRPPTLLSDDEIRQTKKKLKEISVKFDEEDLISGDRVSKEQVERRRAQWAEWQAYKKRKEDDYRSREAQRRALHEGRLSDEEDIVEQDEEIEVLVKEEIVVIE